MKSKEAIFNRSEALQQLRERWTSNIAHDLSGSLFSARGFVRMTLNRPGLAAESMKHLKDALRSLDRAIGSVKELRDSPVERLELSWFTLRDVIADALQGAGAAFASRNIHFAHESGSESLPIVGDRAILTRAIEGFLSAAAECAENGGGVKVTAVTTEGRVTVQVTATALDAIPDLIAASRLWQSHGGSILTHEDDGEFAISCELPVIRVRQLEEGASQ